MSDSEFDPALTYSSTLSVIPIFVQLLSICPVFKDLWDIRSQF
jgi:uncharacterized BrkB/YihY/UPF0761 family membrane protein